MLRLSSVPLRVRANERASSRSSDSEQVTVMEGGRRGRGGGGVAVCALPCTHLAVLKAWQTRTREGGFAPFSFSLLCEQ